MNALITRLDTGGRLEKAERTASGVRVPARLTRTGVLTYQMRDGTTRRELRHPDEVFRADSLKTLRGAPVVAGHPYEIGGLLDPGTWRRFTRGHAADDVRQDGEEHVAGSLVVNDGATLDAIDTGELTDVSLGYQARWDPTPGVWKGERYDGIQRDITYNHVSLEPPGIGRAGRDVGLRLDSKGPDVGIEVRTDAVDAEVAATMKAHHALEERHARTPLELATIRERRARDARFDADAQRTRLDARRDRLDERDPEAVATLAFLERLGGGSAA